MMVCLIWSNALLLFLDVDECASNDNKCSKGAAICKNTVGSYNCTCKFGYYWDGTECKGLLISFFSLCKFSSRIGNATSSDLIPAFRCLSLCLHVCLTISLHSYWNAWQVTGAMVWGEIPFFPERGYQISLYENNGQYIINFFLRLIFFYLF